MFKQIAFAALLLAFSHVCNAGQNATLGSAAGSIYCDRCVLVGFGSGAGSSLSDSVAVGFNSARNSSGQNVVAIGKNELSNTNVYNTVSINGSQIFVSGPDETFSINPHMGMPIEEAPIYYKEGVLHLNAKTQIGDADIGGQTYKTRHFNQNSATNTYDRDNYTQTFSGNISTIRNYNQLTSEVQNSVTVSNIIVVGEFEQSGKYSKSMLSFDMSVRRAYEVYFSDVAATNIEYVVDNYKVENIDILHSAEITTNGVIINIEVDDEWSKVKATPINTSPRTGDQPYKLTPDYSSFLTNIGYFELYYGYEIPYDIEELELSPYLDTSVSKNLALVHSAAIKTYVDANSHSVSATSYNLNDFDMFLAPWGDDKNDGLSPDFPKKTIEGCYSAATTNIVVCVFPGDYAPISNEQPTLEYSLFQPKHNLTFFAVGGNERTSITGEYTSSTTYTNGFYHTLAFNSGPQRFIGFTLRKLSGWARSHAMKGNSPAMSCVVLENCIVDNCDINTWLTFGGINTCAFLNTSFRNVSFTNNSTGNNTSAMFTSCEFENCKVELTSFVNASGVRTSFFDSCSARKTLFSLPPVIPTEKLRSGSKKSTFEDCTFVFDYDSSLEGRVLPAACTNCYFCVGNGYTSTNGYNNVFAASWTNTYLNADFVADSIKCPAVRYDDVRDAGWKNSGLSTLKTIDNRANSAGEDGDGLVHNGGRINGDLTIGNLECQSGYQVIIGGDYKEDVNSQVTSVKIEGVEDDLAKTVEIRNDGVIERLDSTRNLDLKYNLPNQSGTLVVDAMLGGCTFGFENGDFCVYTNGVKIGTLTFTPVSE